MCSGEARPTVWPGPCYGGGVSGGKPLFVRLSLFRGRLPGSKVHRRVRFETCRFRVAGWAGQKLVQGKRLHFKVVRQECRGSEGLAQLEAHQDGAGDILYELVRQIESYLSCPAVAPPRKDATPQERVRVQFCE